MAFYRQYMNRRWHLIITTCEQHSTPCNYNMSNGVDAAWKKDNISNRCSSRAWHELTLWSPRRGCMGTAEAGFSHSGRRGQRSRCRRLMRTRRVALVSDDNIGATDIAWPAADWRARRPVTGRQVTCTQPIYRQLARAQSDEMLVDLTAHSTDEFAVA